MHARPSRSVSVGDRAPHFVATPWTGTPIDLRHYRGRKVWLAFFRFASCPLSNLRVHEIRKRYEDFKRSGLAVLAVFQSPPERVAAHVGKQHPPFPIVCDPEESLYLVYGLRASVGGLSGRGVATTTLKAATLGYVAGPIDGTVTRLPADFLIDEQGVVRDIQHAQNIGDHIPFGRVEAFIQGHQVPLALSQEA